MHRCCIVVLSLVLIYPAIALAALFGDDFDTDTSASWTVNQTSADNAVFFAYDYSADGIPSAPHSAGGTTKGLKMQSNLASPASIEALTLSPNGQSFGAGGGNYKLTFDMWINWPGGSTAATFAGGGASSTEMVTAGVGYNGTGVNYMTAAGNATTRATVSATANGAWFAVDGDAGFAALDYRAFKGNFETRSNDVAPNAGVYAAGTAAPANGGPQEGNNAYYTTTFPGGIAPPAAQGQVAGGVTVAGQLGFAWHTVELNKVGNSVTWTIDGLLIATLTDGVGTNGPVPLSGNISIGFTDPTTSVATALSQSFGLIDNVVVTPEPAVMALMGLGSLLMLRRRR